MMTTTMMMMYDHDDSVKMRSNFKREACAYFYVTEGLVRWQLTAWQRTCCYGAIVS